VNLATKIATGSLATAMWFAALIVIPMLRPPRRAGRVLRRKGRRRHLWKVGELGYNLAIYPVWASRSS
jgi:hypothetical protein